MSITTSENSSFNPPQELANQILDTAADPLDVSLADKAFRSTLHQAFFDRVKSNLCSSETRTLLSEIGFSYGGQPTNETVKALGQCVSSLLTALPGDRVQRYGLPSVNRIMANEAELQYFVRFAINESKP
jgi:hypothetical protein